MWEEGGRPTRAVLSTLKSRVRGQLTRRLLPARTPAMIGCSFVVDREYFGDIGLLDPGMEVYGGENIELGMRVSVTVQDTRASLGDGLSGRPVGSWAWLVGELLISGQGHWRPQTWVNIRNPMAMGPGNNMNMVTKDCISRALLLLKSLALLLLH